MKPHFSKMLCIYVLSSLNLAFQNSLASNLLLNELSSPLDVYAVLDNVEHLLKNLSPPVVRETNLETLLHLHILLLSVLN